MMTYYANRNQPLLELTATTTLDLGRLGVSFPRVLSERVVSGDRAARYCVHAVPFALAHLTKPPLETLSTIFGGMAFWWVAWRTRSFVYPFLIHLYIMLFTALVVTRLGG
jgi:Type II CAAX prenyl endopeptidase Rce1-like